MYIFIGLMIPLVGTIVGAALVFFIRDGINASLEKTLLGFAAGIMTAASVWSLLIPSMEYSSHMGTLSFLPATLGFFAGIIFLLIMDRTIPHLHIGSDVPEGGSKEAGEKLKRTTMLMFAVTLHNIPEGMAIGVVFGGILNDNTAVTMAGAISLTVGIAIQNIPEGAVISMPLKTDGGMAKGKAFLLGSLSGVVEPVAAGMTLLFMSVIQSSLPYLLAFAAGAMIYVVVEELIPETAQGKHSNVGTLGFAAGFVIMMVLDSALG